MKDLEFNPSSIILSKENLGNVTDCTIKYFRHIDSVQNDIPSVDEEIKKTVNKRQSEKLGRVVAFLKSGSEAFTKACKEVKLPETKRQASKWLMKKGKAWKDGR